MRKGESAGKMRISFDLDEVLFVSPADHKIEKRLVWLLCVFFRENLRMGTPALINELQSLGYEVWVYTSSFRSERYIRTLFRLYGVRFDGIVNANRHLREVQRNSKTILPQKVPSWYKISLHVDDEEVICSSAVQYGYHAYRLDAQDDDWKDKIIARAAQIKKARHFD